MAIFFSKDAAKAILNVMEKEGLDRERFAIYLGYRNESLTLAFVLMSDNQQVDYHSQHGLNISFSDKLPTGVMIEFGRSGDRPGLLFVNKDI